MSSDMAGLLEARDHLARAVILLEKNGYMRIAAIAGGALDQLDIAIELLRTGGRRLR